MLMHQVVDRSGVTPRYSVLHSGGMPTNRRRYVVTETEPVAQALNAAARRWPADRDNRSRLLAHLLREGHRAVTEEAENVAANRRKAVTQTAGALTGLYGESYLRDLREDWPE